MAIRVSPYLLSLIDWNDPVSCPIRKQFIPLKSQLLPDHPMLTFDSLGEQSDSPVKGLTHRYEDKALFLALDTCPVYCRFCTRSYAVGSSTAAAEKVSIKASRERWDRIFDYLRETKQVEDVVISGGDSYRLKARQIKEIGEELLKIDHIRRFRFATKGPAVMPMKILTDMAWTDAVSEISDKARKQRKEACIHTHFNHANEITDMTEQAMGLLFERGVRVRNQAVFQNDVNNDSESMLHLVKQLSYINVQPYYVYVHAPGGGGKRDAHSFEHYDRETGISVYTAPGVKPGEKFLYCDPLHTLSEDIQKAWADESLREQMINDAIGSLK